MDSTQPTCWSKRRKNKRARFNSYAPPTTGSEAVTSHLSFLGVVLPSEIVFHVISYLPLSGVLKFRGVGVASNIYALYYLESLKWITLSDFKKITVSSIFALLQKCRNISFLDVSECVSISYDALSALSTTFPNTRVQAPFNFFVRYKEKFLADIGQNNFGIFRSLHNLSLSDMDLRGIPLLLNSENLRFLEIRFSKLDISSSSNVSFSNLHRLRLERVTFTESRALASLLNCIQSLEMFDIAECNGFAEGELAPLARFKNMHTLMILGCTPDEETLRSIPWQGIKKLALDKKEGASASLHTIASCLLSIQDLGALVLGYNLVCDAFFETLSMQTKNPLQSVKKLILGASNASDSVCDLSNSGLTKVAELFPGVIDLCLAAVHTTAFANFPVQSLRTLRFLDTIFPQDELQRILDSYVNLQKLVVCTYSGDADLTVSLPKLRYFEFNNASVRINFKNCPNLKKIYCDVDVRASFDGECPQIQTIDFCGVPDPVKICDMLTNQEERPKYQIIRCKLPEEEANHDFAVDLVPIFKRYRGHVCVIHKSRDHDEKYDVAREITKIARLVVDVGDPYDEKNAHPVVAFERYGTKVTTNIPIFEVMAASRAPDSRAKIGSIPFWDHCLILDVESMSASEVEGEGEVAEAVEE